MAVECYICLEGCKSPTCPPCGHVFCEVCLEAHVLTQRNKDHIKCPVCKTKFAVDAYNRWYLPQKLRKLREAPSLRRLYTSDSDIGSSTVELQAQLDRAMATERELKEELARRPTDVWMLEAQIEERDERIVRLEKMVTEMKSRVAEKDAKVHQLVYCIVALMAVVIDLGLIMFMK